MQSPILPGSSSGAQVTIVKSKCSTEQNVSFVDMVKGPMSMRNTVTDPTVSQSMNHSADLGAFLERPIMIQEYNRSSGGPDLNDEFDPWTLWSTNSQVKSKLDNFAYFRGDLMIKVVVNGNPFLYGKTIMSYMPLSTSRQLPAELLPDGLAVHLVPGLAAVSQRPHVMIDYSTDAGACLCLPFLWPRNAIEVATSSEWAALGRLRVDDILSPQLANAITNGMDATITIFAWATDVKLTVPTYSLAHSQGGEEHDMDGLVSKPASIVAAASMKLAEIPVIRPFALASSVAASAVGRIAAIFGYSKPACVNAPSTMRRDPANQMMNSSGVDATNSMTFDPKSAVTIWPGVTGVDQGDEMALSYLTKRESILQLFDWSQIDDPGQRVFWAGVHPMETPSAWAGTADLRNVFQPTPLSFATTPFSRWSGTIKYRIQIIASRFHRGRLKISWDPYSLTGASAVDNLNTNFSQIIDLTESRDLEFSVAWGRPELYLPLNPYTNWYCSDFVNGDGTTQGAFNGFLSITVLNRLIAPIESAGTVGQVRVAVWVSAGDDYEVQLPSDALIEQMSYRPVIPVPQENGLRESKLEPLARAEGGEEQTDAAEENTQIPTQSIDLIVDPSPEVVGEKNMICFGEKIVSFRNLLKRYLSHSVTYSAIGNTANSGSAAYCKYVRSDFPAYKGYTPYGLYNAQFISPEPYQAAKMTLLNYLTPAYKCRRGGIRQMYVPFIATNRSGGSSSVIISREPDDAKSENFRGTSMNSQVDFSDAGNPPQQDLTVYNIGFAGQWTTHTTQQTLLKFQTPYYSGARFVPGDFLDVEADFSPDGSDQATLKHSLVSVAPLIQNNGNSDVPTVGANSYRRYVAASDDFSLSFFIQAPPFLLVSGDFTPSLVGVIETII